MANFIVNGQAVDVDADPKTPLLWVIREHLKITGTKFGCGVGQCGACTVHIDGAATYACLTPVAAVEGREVLVGRIPRWTEVRRLGVGGHRPGPGPGALSVHVEIIGGAPGDRPAPGCRALHQHVG